MKINLNYNFYYYYTYVENKQSINDEISDIINYILFNQHKFSIHIENLEFKLYSTKLSLNNSVYPNAKFIREEFKNIVFYTHLWLTLVQYCYEP